MADYAVTFARSARRELENLEARHIDRVLARIEGLAAAPRPSGAKKLQGTQQLRRLRSVTTESCMRSMIASGGSTSFGYGTAATCIGSSASNLPCRGTALRAAAEPPSR